MEAKELENDYFDNAPDEFVDFLERIGEEGVKRQEQSFWNIILPCEFRPVFHRLEQLAQTSGIFHFFFAHIVILK